MLEFSIYKIALTLGQSVKQLAVKLFRLHAKELTSYEALEEAVKRGFKLKKSTPRTFEISAGRNGVGTSYILRKKSSDLLVFNQVILHHEYKTLIELVGKHSRTENIYWVVDAGANIGLTSLYLSDILREARIVAVEPSAENFKMLKENVSLNGRTRIIPIQNALWSERCNVKLSNAFRDRQEWSFRVSSDPSGLGDVEALTLRDIMVKGGIESIDLLKIDIEGAEKELLSDKSFLEELKSVKFLAIELHEEAVNKIQVVHQLESLGFDLIYKGETLFGVNLVALEKIRA